MYTIAKKEVDLYSDIYEMPYRRFSAFNKYLLISSGVADNVDELDRKLERVLAFISTGDASSAIEEVLNFRQSIELVISQVSPKMLALACLVKTIDGVAKDDISEEGLARTLAELNTEKTSALLRIISEVTKKLKAK